MLLLLGPPDLFIMVMVLSFLLMVCDLLKMRHGI